MSLTRQLPRTTDETINITRWPGKIAIEEACGSPFFNANQTIPRAPLIHGFKGKLPFSDEVIADVEKRLNDTKLRIQSMDQSGIEFEIVSLTSPGIEGVCDPKLAAEYARKTNDWMYETFVKAHPDRFGFFACVPMQDPKAAAEELERAVTKLGAKGVLINGYSNVNPDNMSDVQYLDAERICWDYPAMCQAAFAFGNETAGHAVRIMCSGLLDKYSNVQIILGHCAEALPFLAHRIDHRFSDGSEGMSGPHKKTMMYYLQNNFIATLAGVRRQSTMNNTITEMGEGRVLFSVDYPYESHEEASDWFDGLEMADGTRHAIATENAKRWLKI
ncbi:hypothetical protein KCU98_g1155, partial [Aureobasidium melanogenum]